MLNAADFGDLLLECIRLFREHPEVLRGYQQRFKYILVDEYQDTNVAQYLWLRLLGQSRRRGSDAPHSSSPASDAAQQAPSSSDEGSAASRERNGPQAPCIP